MTKFQTAKDNLNAFYKARAKRILYQNRAEEFDMTDVTKIYESLNNYKEGSTIKKLEVDRMIYKDRQISKTSSTKNSKILDKHRLSALNKVHI